MRIRRPKLVQGNIHRQVAVGEKIVVRGSWVYKLPDYPGWVRTGIDKKRWMEKLIDGLFYRGWFKSSDIYIRITLENAPDGHPLAYVIPSIKGEGAIILKGINAQDLVEDAQIFDRLRDGALFLKISP
ncbi:MAG TPA: hypothetical protein VI794_01845 [Patescibacteria group bacterium]|nr:hypothetical protein [Patescibacteria group bacterium]